MARTLTVAQALNLAVVRLPKALPDGFGARFADEVLGYMWTKYDWKESLAELPPFHLIRDEHDYGPPLLAVPSDFFALHDARVRNSNSYTYPPLTIHKQLRMDETFGIPTSIAYQKETASFRVHPIPATGGADWWIEGSYKKTPTKITNQNMTSYLLPWDDIYFSVFRQGLRAKLAHEIEKDPKAINEFVMFERMLDRMATDEGVHEGVTIIAPADDLALGG